MENNENVISENNVEVADQHDVLEDTQSVEETEQVVEENTTEETTEQTEEVGTVEQTQSKQSDADNKAARLARLQAEKEAEAKIEKARKEAFEQGLKQGKVDSFIGKQNPYTGKIIQDKFDVQEYQDMYELDLAGKNPLEDYMELQKSRARDEAKRQLKLDEELKQREWYEKDAKDFSDKYGPEKFQELLKDKDFDMFANGKIGVQPLSKIYEDFIALTQKYKQNSIETAKRIVANNNATPGALNDGAPQEINWENMSSDKFKEYLEKAKNGELR